MLLKGLGMVCKKVPKLFCDNVSAKHMTMNLGQYACINHINIDCHFVRDLMLKKSLNIQY